MEKFIFILCICMITFINQARANNNSYVGILIKNDSKETKPEISGMVSNYNDKNICETEILKKFKMFASMIINEDWVMVKYNFIVNRNNRGSFSTHCIPLNKFNSYKQNDKLNEMTQLVLDKEFRNEEMILFPLD